MHFRASLKEIPPSPRGNAVVRGEIDAVFDLGRYKSCANASAKLHNFFRCVKKCGNFCYEKGNKYVEAWTNSGVATTTTLSETSEIC